MLFGMKSQDSMQFQKWLCTFRMFLLSLVALFCCLTNPSPVLQDKLLAAEIKEKGGEGTEEEQTSTFSEETQQKILDMFTATTKEFGKDGRLKLTYKFTSLNEGLASDFGPEFSKTKKRIRWSGPIDRGYSDEGVHIADQGIFLHKAKWGKQLSVKFDYLPMSNKKKGDFIAAVFCYAKGGRSIGANAGRQLVKLKNLSMKGRGYPKDAGLSLIRQKKVNFGYSIENGVFTAIRAGQKTVDSSVSKSFMKKVETGNVGLSWKGSIGGFINGVEIEGYLDPKWVEKQLKK